MIASVWWSTKFKHFFIQRVKGSEGDIRTSQAGQGHLPLPLQLANASNLYQPLKLWENG